MSSADHKFEHDEEGRTATTVAPPTPAMAARYGNTAERRGRQRMLGWVVALLFVAIFAGWVVWVAFDGVGASIEARDIGHTIVDDRSATVTFEISMTAGTAATCALQVQNEQHAIVGWKVVEIPASDRYTRTFTETVYSTELGVTGLLYRCWLT